jgi:hypothetical protein
VEGSKTHPVTDLTIAGVTFTASTAGTVCTIPTHCTHRKYCRYCLHYTLHTALTASTAGLLDDLWTTPSGGDWALNRNGAVFVEGSERMVVQGCTFRRLDGTALMLSGYNRNATVKGSEFVWLGQNAIASWGDTEGVDATGIHCTTLIQKGWMLQVYTVLH